MFTDARVGWLTRSVIDTIPFESADGPLRLFNAFTSSVKDRPAGAKAAYIYCGGSWTMSRGDGGLESWTDERQPNSGRIALTKWRSEVEHEVLGSECFTSSFKTAEIQISGMAGGVEGELMMDRQGSTWYRDQTRSALRTIGLVARDDDLPSCSRCQAERREV